MKLTPEKYQKVWDVIDEHRLITDRVRALRKLRFKVIQCPVGRGRACVGLLHHYTKSVRMQIGSPKGYLKYAWVVMFNPMDYVKVHEYNRKTFGQAL